MKNICIYHGNCADGFSAALAVKMYFDNRDEDCEFVPANYGDTPPYVKDKNVLIVDFSYPREVLLEMYAQAEHMHVIDHHKTAQKALEGLDFCTFNMNKSGAMLTWECLHTAEAPILFEYIQDRDLWQWKLDCSKEVSAALQLLPFDFEIWKNLLSSPIVDLVDKGRVILDYQDLQIKRVIAQGLPLVNIAGYEVPCINTTTLISEMGDEISKGYAFAAMYFETKDKRVYSLRSASDGIDVSEIAEKFGGGGHFHAAGFSIDKPKVELVEQTYPLGGC